MATKAKNTSSDYGVFLFLIWPFFAAIFAIRNYRAAWAKDLIWLFVVGALQLMVLILAPALFIYFHLTGSICTLSLAEPNMSIPS